MFKDVLWITDTFSNIVSVHLEYSIESKRVSEYGEQGYAVKLSSTIRRPSVLLKLLLKNEHYLLMNNESHCLMGHLLAFCCIGLIYFTSQEETSNFVQPSEKEYTSAMTIILDSQKKLNLTWKIFFISIFMFSLEHSKK